MNWLDPEEVREWLANRNPPDPAEFQAQGKTLTQYGRAVDEWEQGLPRAWAEFGRAVAAEHSCDEMYDAEVLPDLDEQAELLDNLIKVARLIRDCEEGK